MTTFPFIDPSTCPKHKTYVGTVTTASGTHQRILTRPAVSKEYPWSFIDDQWSITSAQDHQISQLREIEPSVFTELDDLDRKYKHALEEIQNLTDDLKAERYVRRLLQRVVDAPGKMAHNAIVEAFKSMVT